MASDQRWLELLVVGLAAALVLALGTTRAAPDVRGADPAAAAAMLDLVNGARADAGLQPLQPAADIATVAEAWSAAMAVADELEHNPDHPEQICCWTSVAENVAFSDPHRWWRPGDPLLRLTEELHLALLDSPGHRANLLEPTFDEIGIGVHVHTDGSVWITQNFRRAAP
jgi:uncharacterized protein YkwD